MTTRSAKIERVLLDPGYLAAREARLRAEYRPRTWADCVQALISKLDQPAPADPRSSAAPPAAQRSPPTARVPSLVR